MLFFYSTIIILFSDNIELTFQNITNQPLQVLPLSGSISNVVLNTFDYDIGDKRDDKKHRHASWLVDWVRIKLENGDRYFCHFDTWIDQK